MYFQHRNLFAVSVLALAFAVVGGCAHATPEAMTPQLHAAVHPHGGSVTVTVNRSFDDPFIDPKDFGKAIERTIVDSKLFDSVPGQGPADYKLEVSLLKIDYPPAGFDMTVNMFSSWTLRAASNDRLLWKQDEASIYTARLGEAFAGVERAKKAGEGAARENIRQGIESLASTELPPR